MFDVIIIGAGPAAVGALRHLRGLSVAVIDVGNKVDDQPKPSAFYDTHVDPDALLGAANETLSFLIDGRAPVTPKLKSAALAAVIRDPGFSTLDSPNFEAKRSYALGGLSNAWGAQLYRYHAADMRGWAIGPDELTPYYNELEKHIGIAGENDDLSSYYGFSGKLLKPTPMTPAGMRLERRYNACKQKLNRKGIFLGRPRLGVLTEEYDGRPAHQFRNMEFFEANGNGIYCPRQDIETSIKNQSITYISGKYAQTFAYTKDGVTVHCLDANTREHCQFHGKRLLLAAGCLESTRIVANSLYPERSVSTTIVENLLSYTPYLSPLDIGSPVEPNSFYAQQNLMFDGFDNNGPVQGTFYALRGVLHSDLVRDMPLSTAASIPAIRLLSNALLVLHLWYPGAPDKRNSLTVLPSGDIQIDYSTRLNGSAEAQLISSLRALGLYSMKSLSKYPAPGNSYHYVGTMPMSPTPQEMQTDRQGRVFGAHNVYSIDGACLPALSAKNHSLTIMANAARIAADVRRTIHS